MKYSVFLSLFFLAMLAACDNGSGAKNANEDSADGRPGKKEEAQKDLPEVSGCYMRVSGRDTLVVRINQTGEDVRGNIYFDNYQKDGSAGTATGKIKDDTVHLYYSFQSEGMHSVMEMYFQVKDNQLIRGIGDMGVKGDTAYFTSVASVTFPGKEILNKISCTDLRIKFSD